MVSIGWCKSVKNGLELVELNENMASSYLGMAKESLDMIKNVSQSRIWEASTSYYTMYYSLYSLMMKIGIKCEIHSCSLEFMKKFLQSFYSEEEIYLIKIAFDLRSNLQYYPDKLIDESKLLKVKQGAVDFFVKTKEIVSRVTESQISEVRNEFEEVRE